MTFIKLIFLILFLIFLLEIVFRILVKLIFGRSYELSPRFNKKNLYVIDHPYLPFVLKENSVSNPKLVASYPLHKGKIFLPSVNHGSLGFATGKKGNEIIEIPKPKHIKRICCLGASTTGNYVGNIEKNIYTSYPLELEKYLRKITKNKNIQVVNCGIGGSNSADLLIRYSLQIIDMQPDILIMHHGHNDIYNYLTKGFKSDYSHSVRGLSRSMYKFKLASFIPYIPLKSIQYIINLFLPIRGVHNNLLKLTRIGKFDLNQEYETGLSIYKRNLQSIIDIAKARGTKIILVTFAHYLYDDIKKSKLHNKFAEIIKAENRIMRDLAIHNDLKIVDNEKNMPKETKYFVDSIHFTMEGMKRLALNIGKVIYKDLKINLDI